MKTLSVIAVLLFAFSANAEMNVSDYNTVTLTKSSDPAPYCPATKISNNDKCMTCHALVKDKEGNVKFGLGEIDPFSQYSDKPHSLKIVYEEGEVAGYVKISGTGSTIIEDIVEYLPRHPEIKKLIIELHTPGGSVMDAWRTVGLIKKIQSMDVVVSTRCYGIAASAGVILLVAGDIGERVVSANAEIMIHKVWTFKMFDLQDPDTAADQAATLDHFQKNINSFILSRSKMTEEKLKECIFKKDFWMTGEDAVEFGLADKLLK